MKMPKAIRRGKFNQTRKKSRTNVGSSLTKKQKKHLKDFGEHHPFDTVDTVRNYTIVKDESDRKEKKVTNEDKAYNSDDETTETSTYDLLLQSLSDQGVCQPTVISDSDSGDSNDDSGDDSGDDIGDDEGSAVESERSEVSGVTRDTGPVDTHEDADEEQEVSSEGDEEDEEDEEDVEDEHDKSTHKEVVDATTDKDYFRSHFENVLSEDTIPKLQSPWKQKDIQMKQIGHATQLWKLDESLQHIERSSNGLKHVNQKLLGELSATNRTLGHATPDKNESLSLFQNELFSTIQTYQDLYFSRRSHANGEEIRVLYCLHALNHALITRQRVMANSAKIKATKSNVNVDYRDQGLTRPKVLIVVPFRESVLRIVNIMIELMSAKGEAYVSNKKRLHKEFSDAFAELPKKSSKSDDYLSTFAGNTDDHFRLGLSIAKKTLKIYTQFYVSDIIVASPLGLRTVIADSGEDSDHDFLSSIEMLILDQADVFLMQNWDHLVYIMDHMHLQPKEAHGVDFSRVRMWSLNGWSKFYRQTLIFSAVPSPLINSLFTKHCHNYHGKLSIQPSSTNGSICQVVVQLPQVFHRFECGSFTDMPDARFNYFTTKILPHHKDPVMTRTLIFIPSYFDYVRVRNYLAREELNFTQICEYTKHKSMSRARNDMFRGKVQFLLYTERAHFYHRLTIRGIHHIIFYALPVYPNFYPELCNALRGLRSTDALTCTVIYSKYDARSLAEIVGTKRAGHLISSRETSASHMFVTGDDS